MTQLPVLGDVMTANPIGVEASSSLNYALSLMNENNINHLVVMDGSGSDANPDSIISSSDIHKATLLGGQTIANCELSVADICPSKAYIADIDDALPAPLQAMADSHGGTIIVLKDGALAGIFTPGDACRLLSQYLQHSTTNTSH